MTVSPVDADYESFVNVRMGDLCCGRSDAALRTLLGSCVGIVLYDPAEKAGGLAHVMLPDSDGHDDVPGKFVDTAISELITQLESLGAQRRRMTARIAGGASMFGSGAALDIGQRNVNAAIEQLENVGVPLTGSHVGGTQGRQMMFSVATGCVAVQVVGSGVVEL